MAVQRAFADPDLTPDDFQKFSKQEVSADTKEKGLQQLEAIPPVRSTEPMELASVLSGPAVQKIQNSGEITFHVVGDTGGIHNPEFQFAVADAMADDVASSNVSFWYHLGDVVYYFGQDQYYFDQFYDPYRNYSAPIFAIPGNHDAVVFTGENAKSLDAFIGNFCTPQPTQNRDSQGAVRTTMDQPGVYFTLNAPFAKFIGLYSNTSEGATEGVIAGPKVGNAQLQFLNQQLAAAKAERSAGQNRALIIATHHPPFTGSPFHVPSPGMLSQIDQACKTAGIWPDLHLSGHSHLYERYTRTVNGKQIAYIVAGMGGFYNLAGLKPKAPAPPKTPASGTDAAGNPLRIDVYKDKAFGFVRITVSSSSVSAQFVSVDPSSRKTAIGDSFVIDLKAGKVSAGTAKISAGTGKVTPGPKQRGKSATQPRKGRKP
jgi:hypothetical protein